MGLCFSKKKKTPPGKVAAAATVADDKVAAKKTAKSAGAKAATPDKNAVKAKAAVATPAGEEKKKKLAPQAPPAPAPARTSSCTKDEVDAILIQCGRLSRSSSGTGRTPSRETGGEGSHHRRRRLGSKRSYDFDQERMAAAGGDEEGDWESRPVSRPSPHRGSPQRKRSGSRERSGGGSGSRRASRSPGRRGEGGVTSGGGERARQQQPGKMVSVPAREKLRAPSPAAASGIRCAPPRSSSPARMAVAANENACGVVPAAGPTPALSRSSSRKAEQSPYRRNPMAEIDENTLRSNNGKPHKVGNGQIKFKSVCHFLQLPTVRSTDPTGIDDYRNLLRTASPPRTRKQPAVLRRRSRRLQRKLPCQTRERTRQGRTFRAA
jgi:hypothetical protein